jgi:hypothetical protein
VAEFAIVMPILLLILAGAADVGRAFYAFVAIENAAKEGAFFGARNPDCATAAGPGCADPNNVVWRVRTELRDQGIRTPGGAELTPTTACVSGGGGGGCGAGDMYEVGLTYPFRLITPILGSMVGDINLRATARAAVLNVVNESSPGLSIQKFVLPTTASNGIEVISKCREPDDVDAAGYYRSPCRDSSTADPGDVLTLRFEQGVTISYRIRIGNIGDEPLSGVTVVDSRGSPGCSWPGSLSVGASMTCDYRRTAPNVTGSRETIDYENTATIDATQTTAAMDGALVIIERPPPRFQVLKWVSPFREGGDGDGEPGFGTDPDVTISHSTQIPDPHVWYKIIVRNVGGRPATDTSITDTNGALPFGQNDADAECQGANRLRRLDVGELWECRYRVVHSASSPAVTDNTVSVTSPDVTPDGNDQATARVRVVGCTGGPSIPDLIGLTRAQAEARWSAAGFSSTLDWSGGGRARTQSIQAFDCEPASVSMRVTTRDTP